MTNLLEFVQPMPQRLAALLPKFRFRWSREADLQVALARVLTDAGITHEREVALSGGGTIDFVVRGARAPKQTGVEVKVDGGAIEVVRQLQRYAASPELDALVLVTTLQRHRCPPVLGGKPVTVVMLRPNWL